MIIMTLVIEMFAMLFIVLLFKENPFQMGSIGDESIITITFGIAFVMLAFVALIIELFINYEKTLARR